MKKPRINPLSRMARSPRLVMAVRGGAGVGKSHFARSLADAGLGRLCVFDVERKSRLLRGVGSLFDGLEVESPDELPEFIDWALSSESGQDYGCFALDSWAAYFGAKHSAMLQAVRERTGDPLAQPTAEELASDQMVLQGVLRRLCMESGKSVVIIDQIPARGKEAKEDNEIGRVLPMTASGLEYFVDVMVELSLQERDGEIVRVFQVVKSNSDAFTVGDELTGNVTFKDFLARLEGGDFALPANPAPPASAFLPDEPEAAQTRKMTLEEFSEKALSNGFKQSDLVTAARIYHGQSNLYRLTPDQIEDLDRRMTARIQKLGGATPSTGAPAGLKKEVGGTTLPKPKPIRVPSEA